MYIELDKIHKLDNLIKDFEVALRSYIADNVIQRFPTDHDLSSSLSAINIHPSIIFSKKIEGKIKSLISNNLNGYKCLVNCRDSFKSHTYNNDVPYVSTLIDYLVVYFNEIFAPLNIAKNFSSIEDFYYCLNVYHNCRNNLSHPASKQVLETDAQKIIFFLTSLTANIPDTYFWYSSKLNINTHIHEYNSIAPKNGFKKSNLKNIRQSHKNLLLRENVIKFLYDSIIGTESVIRTAGSIILYGYGGVGKTAILIEFLNILEKDRKNDKIKDMEFVLFYSSKDEYLKENKTTGELYIDEARPEFKTLDELKNLVLRDLDIKTIEESSSKFKRGLIAIDNFENLTDLEKNSILSFIKHTPRSIQFILTSRNEEPCEEKYHIEEFTDKNKCLGFIDGIIENYQFDIILTPEMKVRIYETAKGNPLIIIQLLNIINNSSNSFESTLRSVASLTSRNTEAIASFMYKNTFDRVILELSNKGYAISDIIVMISIYDEPIELYSMSKLAKIPISEAENLCNLLCSNLILEKNQEYFQINEFAKRFIFIKMLPDHIALEKIKQLIYDHKTRMRNTLNELEVTLKNNPKLRRIISEWQPNNYIDKIVIAEVFPLFHSGETAVNLNKKSKYDNILIELDEHLYVTSHPYVHFQKARVMRLSLKKFNYNNQYFLVNTSRAFEDAIEAIEYRYRHLMESNAYISLLMIFGIFLTEDLRDNSRAIRYLDMSSKMNQDIDKNWFTCHNYLAKAYKFKLQQTSDRSYRMELDSLINKVISNETKLNALGIDISMFKQQYLHFSRPATGQPATGDRPLLR